MAANALRVLLADNQPAELWALSTFLATTAYEVMETSSGQQAAQLADWWQPQFVITGERLDDGDGISLCRRLRSRSTGDYLCLLFWTDSQDAHLLSQAVRAGADDILTRPIVHGELLARLRAAARRMEFERRLRETRRLDSLTSAVTRQVLLERLQQLLEAARASPAGCCVVADLDVLALTAHQHGVPSSQAILVAAARHLASLVPDGEPVARLGPNRFGVLLPDAEEEEGWRWSEQARQTLAALEFPVPGGQTRQTASFGVAQCERGGDPAEVLQLAERALRMAKRCGRNRVVRASAMGSMVGSSDGSSVVIDPLRNTLARDVMTPHIAWLPEHAPVAQAMELMKHCRLNALPVVDAAGQLKGTLCGSSLRGRTSGTGHRQVSEFLARDVAAFDEETTVQALYDHFRHSAASRVEITSEGRPAGFVTRGTLAALAETVTQETFAAMLTGETSADLLVPDLVWVEDP
jgi:diguanylate cyclase (GGDEF)-like protein